MKRVNLLLLLPAFALLGQGCFSPSYSNINSFAECVSAGYPIMESFPRQCRTPDGRNFTEQLEPSATSTPSSSPLWAEPNGVAVANQRPGRAVIISALILQNDGWVVVHASDSGLAGRIIGETFLKAGEYSQVKVNLREDTQDGRSYFAMLHLDDGDATFDSTEDTPVKSTQLDAVVAARFQADASASEPPVVSP